MSDRLTDDDLRIKLRLHSTPLSGITETEHEWWLGGLSISKHYPLFRSGYGHDLHHESDFRKQWFELDGRRGWGVIFHTAGDPANYLAGWVPPEREAEADGWISFLNAEIKMRLQGDQENSRGLPGEQPARMAKRSLIYVGAFKELGFDDNPDAPSLAASRGRLVTTHKQQIVAYLNAGSTFVFSPGLEEDVFDPGKRAGSSSYATDGTYVWPKVLAYYVERYDVELPATFLAHGESSGWRLPSSIDKKALRLPGSSQGNS